MQNTFPISLKKVTEFITAVKTWCTGTFDSKGSASAVQTNLTTHDNNTTKHITASERTTWNKKISMSDIQPYIDNFDNHINSLSSIRNMTSVKSYLPQETNNETGEIAGQLTFKSTSGKTIQVKPNISVTADDADLEYLFIIKTNWFNKTTNSQHTYYRICGLSRPLIHSDGSVPSNPESNSVRATQIKIENTGCALQRIIYSGFDILLYNAAIDDSNSDTNNLLENPTPETLSLMSNFPILKLPHPMCHFLGVSNNENVSEDIVWSVLSQVTFAKNICGEHNNSPDYEHRTGLNSISEYTAQDNGFVFVQTSGDVIVNGNKITSLIEVHAFTVPLSAGDTITVSGKLVMFVPYK